jgi:hypothetical protein
MLLPGIVSALVAGVLTASALPGGYAVPTIFREAAKRSKKVNGAA